MTRRIINPDIDRAWFIEHMRLHSMRQIDFAQFLEIDRYALNRSLKGTRFFTAPELGKISFLFEEPLAEVAQRAGIKSWTPPQKPPKPKRIQEQEAYDAMKALARALGLKG